MPLVDEIPDPAASALREVGGRPINLYRALANQPEVLRAWIDLAWTLRLRGSVDRSLRELLILRAAQILDSDYEWGHHVMAARAAGLAEAKIAALARWRWEREVYDDRERAALLYTEGVVDGDVSDTAAAALAEHFDPAGVVEITVTAGFYACVGRVLDALAIPLDA